MADHRVLARLDALIRDADLLVYRLETTPVADADAWRAERAAVRREVERLRDHLDELARTA